MLIVHTRVLQETDATVHVGGGYILIYKAKHV